MRDFGTKVVAGVTPGKAGSKIEGVPVFDRVRDAVLKRKANASILFVPAPYAKDAAVEAIEAGIKLVVIITERIPFHDCLDFIPYARSKGVTVIGPNCPGIASPGEAKMGIIPNLIFKERDTPWQTDGARGSDHPGRKRHSRVEDEGLYGCRCAGRPVPRRSRDPLSRDLTCRAKRSRMCGASKRSLEAPRWRARGAQKG